jgi:hypothetical protein
MPSARIGEVESVSKLSSKHYVAIVSMSGLARGSGGSVITWVEQELQPWMVPGTIVVVNIFKGPQPSV